MKDTEGDSVTAGVLLASCIKLQAEVSEFAQSAGCEIPPHQL